MMAVRKAFESLALRNEAADSAQCIPDVHKGRRKPSEGGNFCFCFRDFQQAADGIYSWIVGKYGVLFKGMPQKTSTYHADILAYHVAVNYDPANRRLNMHVRHMDMEVGGRIWYSEAGLEVSRQEEVILKVCNGYAQPGRSIPFRIRGYIFQLSRILQDNC